jgi:hypothetical protein
MISTSSESVPQRGSGQGPTNYLLRSGQRGSIRELAEAQDQWQAHIAESNDRDHVVTAEIRAFSLSTSDICCPLGCLAGHLSS